MQINPSEPNTCGLAANEWSQVWDIVHFVTRGTFADQGEYDQCVPGRVPEEFDDEDLSVDPINLHRPDTSCRGVTVCLRNVDRDVLYQFAAIGKHLGLTMVAIAELPQDNGSCETEAHMDSALLDLSIDGSCPDYCDDESDAQVVLTFDFGDVEQRRESADRAVDQINELVLSTLRANLGVMPMSQRERLAPTLTTLVDQLLAVAA